ncbi:heme peroxidase [Ephemerocybe angulata]|uniref:Peroxidase n=1 Tax=Ephemerocybe angulata TaxID=980116 RepID=A0A8H6ID72_9AGAR|nr:heme peroxidase [Tulosesus angulatus]
MKNLDFFRVAGAVFLSGAPLLASAQGGQQRWPDYRSNELESLWLEGGAEVGWPAILREDTTRFSNFIFQCKQKPFSAPGESTAAQWVRVAYHDMATHNVNDDGLGGLDRSILYELDRPENVGNAFPLSLEELSQLTRYVSGADVIALGVVHSVVERGGPLIPFRGGRIDATEAGPAGVPEPTQTLEEHTEKFRKQGFNKTEMIELVACGHTLGGVTAGDFPDIIDNTTAVKPVSEFDTTRTFDNAVVLEYLKDTTNNLLVIHPNATVVSDKRIFGSDGNKTMETLADEDTFQARCRDLFERMINTVPKSVELTDVFEPIKAKVGRSFLTFNQTLGLHTEIRFLTTNDNRKDPQVTETQNGALAARLGHTPTHYWFNPTIDANTSISKFWFEVDEGNGGQADIYDNGGAGFQIAQDKVIWARDLSFHGQGFPDFIWSFTMAIRNDAGTIGQVSASVETFLRNNKLNFIKSTATLERDTTVPAVAGFDFYTFHGTEKIDDRIYFDVTATIGEEKVTEEYLYNYWVTENVNNPDGPIEFL